MYPVQLLVGTEGNQAGCHFGEMNLFAAQSKPVAGAFPSPSSPWVFLWVHRTKYQKWFSYLHVIYCQWERKSYLKNLFLEGV
jgi:hypothetical protein